jgi:hypothetical protein
MICSGTWADVAQLVEHSLGKGEVISSILIIGSMRLWLVSGWGRRVVGAISPRLRTVKDLSGFRRLGCTES